MVTASPADRALAGFRRVLGRFGVSATLRTTVATEGAYDPSTGGVVGGSPSSRAVQVVLTSKSIPDGGTYRETRLALLSPAGDGEDPVENRSLLEIGSDTWAITAVRSHEVSGAVVALRCSLAAAGATS